MAAESAVDEAEVRLAVEELNVMMSSHAGQIVLDEIDDAGVVHVHFEAFCQGCPWRPATFAATIRPRIMEVPGVTGVEAPGARVSAAAERRFVEMGYGLQAPRTRHLTMADPDADPTDDREGESP